MSAEFPIFGILEKFIKPYQNEKTEIELARDLGRVMQPYYDDQEKLTNGLTKLKIKAEYDDYKTLGFPTSKNSIGFVTYTPENNSLVLKRAIFDKKTKKHKAAKEAYEVAFNDFDEPIYIIVISKEVTCTEFEKIDPITASLVFLTKLMGFLANSGSI